MALEFMLLDARGEEVTRLPDPAGGTFDAAGDFDRLLPLPTELPLDRGFDLAVLHRVEAFEDVFFSTHEMLAIIEDAAALLSIAKPGPEVNGLKRLTVLAEHGAEIVGSRIRSRGD